MSPARILIVRPDHLGDLLLTLPAITALRGAMPDARITFLVPIGLEAVPDHCPAVDQTDTAAFPPLLAPLERSDWDRRAVSEASGLRGHFDLALLPRPDDPWSGALIGAAAIPIRLGYAAPRTRPSLTTALPVPAHRHVARLALDLAAAAAARLGAPGAVNAGAWRPICFVPTAADEAEAVAALATTPARDVPIVLHPGSGWPLKNWPTARWGEPYCLTGKSYSWGFVASPMFLTLANCQSASCAVSISRRNAAGLSVRYVVCSRSFMLSFTPGAVSIR